MGGTWKKMGWHNGWLLQIFGHINVSSLVAEHTFLNVNTDICIIGSLSLSLSRNVYIYIFAYIYTHMQSNVNIVGWSPQFLDFKLNSTNIFPFTLFKLSRLLSWSIDRTEWEKINLKRDNFCLNSANK